MVKAIVRLAGAWLGLVQTGGSKVRSFGLLALRHLVSLPVSTPFRIIVNRCWSRSCK